MSIATRIQSINEHIEDAYNSLNKMGVTANNKNIENIAGLVDQIYENAPKTDYVSGVNLTIENTLKGKLNFKDTDSTEKIGFGNTTQYTTNGYQLLDRSKGRNTFTYRGITTTYNADGSVTMKGTATEAGNIDGILMGDWGMSTSLIDLDTSSQYVLKADGNTNSKIMLILVNGNNIITSSSGSTPSVFTPSYNGITLFMIRYTPASANEAINLTVYPMLSKGNNTTYPFEQYTGSIASPNPSYPQNVNKVTGSNVIKVMNKNVTDGKFRQGGWGTTPSSTRLFTTQNYPVKSGVTYTLSTTLNTSTFKYAVQLGSLPYPQSTSPTFYDSTWKTSSSWTFTASRDGYFGITVAKSNGTDNLTPSDISNATWQLEVGSTATNYIAHQEENYEINLGTIELCKISTYQDYIFKNGKNWYLHKEIGKIVLKGTEDWTPLSTNTSGKYRAQIDLKAMLNSNLIYPSSSGNIGFILCDYYNVVVAGTAGTYGTHQGISLDASGKILIYDETYNTNDISLYKTWLSTHNITVYFVYSTPTTTEITNTTLISQLNAWYNAQSVDDITYITVDGDLPMQLKVKALKK